VGIPVITFTVTALCQLRPFLAYNHGRDVGDVLDSDIREFLASLAQFTDASRLYSLSEELFKKVVIGGNLALQSDEVCVASVWVATRCTGHFVRLLCLRTHTRDTPPGTQRPSKACSSLQVPIGMRHRRDHPHSRTATVRWTELPWWTMCSLC